MKPLLLAGLFLAVTFFACNQHPAPAAATVAAGAGISDSLAIRAMGTYTGRFGRSLITVVINYISGKTVSGYDVHKGLRRNFNGEVTQQGALLNFMVKEPGDNAYDGSFTFSLDTASWKINGKWLPADSSRQKAQEISLSRRVEDNEDDPFHLSYLWLSNGSTDSTLHFSSDGTCVLEFYPNTGDSTSTSQLVTVKGNFEKDTKNRILRIEWEKNEFIKPLSMKLTMDSSRQENDSMYIPAKLHGDGFVFTPMMAG
ncbi:MAG: hypothetical protein JST68_03375 [Bacteroidetes bacterium]|nr:hypothetical protein [Bacteroidota bacterium]